MTGAHNKPDVDFNRLLKLRLVIARFGEMDSARWWNTNGLLGRKGDLLMGRGFPKTQRFAQARTVFAVARARCNEVFNPPGCATLWNLSPALEDQFDARWPQWLEAPTEWTEIFDAIQQPPDDLIDCLRNLDLLDKRVEDEVRGLRRSAEGKAVPLSRYTEVNDDTLTMLAAGFSRSEVGKLAVPYIRLEV